MPWRTTKAQPFQKMKKIDAILLQMQAERALIGRRKNQQTPVGPSASAAPEQKKKPNRRKIRMERALPADAVALV